MATPENSSPRLMRRHLAVVHPDGNAVMIVRHDDGTARLPFLDEPDGDPRRVGGIADFFGPDIPLTSLGELAFAWFDSAERQDGIVSEYLMLCEPHPSPKAGALERFEWVSDAGEITAQAENGAALTELLDWLAGGGADSPMAELPPHCLPGTSNALSAAVRAALPENAEAALLGAVEPEPGLQQLQAWVLSSVWRGQELVVKITTPLWPHEPAVTALLHDLAPETVPEVLALGVVDIPRARRSAPWMAARRYPVTEPERTPSNEAVLRALTALQAKAVSRLPELRLAGMPQRGPLDLIPDLKILWQEAEAAGLTADELATLPEVEAWLTRRLERLAETAPLLLTHGDLHLGNVLLTPRRASADVGPAEADPEQRTPPVNGQLIIFDWTDAALAWPGIDLQTLTEFGLSRESQPVELDALKREYLEAAGEAFSGHAGAELLSRIEGSLDEGTELALAYHAVSYAHIIRSVPRRQKPFVGTAFLLRAVRRLLDQFEQEAA